MDVEPILHLTGKVTWTDNEQQVYRQSTQIIASVTLTVYTDYCISNVYRDYCLKKTNFLLALLC